MFLVGGFLPGLGDTKETKSKTYQASLNQFTQLLIFFFFKVSFSCFLSEILLFLDSLTSGLLIRKPTPGYIV